MIFFVFGSDFGIMPMGHASVTETLNTYSHSMASDFDWVSEVVERMF